MAAIFHSLDRHLFDTASTDFSRLLFDTRLIEQKCGAYHGFDAVSRVWPAIRTSAFLLEPPRLRAQSEHQPHYEMFIQLLIAKISFTSCDNVTTTPYTINIEKHHSFLTSYSLHCTLGTPPSAPKARYAKIKQKVYFTCRRQLMFQCLHGGVSEWWQTIETRSLRRASQSSPLTPWLSWTSSSRSPTISHS